MTRPPVALVVDAGEFRRFMRGIRGFDKALATATRRRLRDAAQPAVQDVKSTILSGPSKGGSKVPLRRTLANGTKVSISTGRLPGVSIVTSGAKLPYPRLAVLYNKAAWRHPVFGNTAVWVTEKGHPFFNVIYRHRQQLRQGMVQALRDAIKSMGATT